MWLLNATHGEMMSMKAAPSCSIAALITGTICSLSPENERATKVAPSCSASATRSMELSVLVAQRVRELPEPDRGGITVAGHTEIDEIAVGQVCAREHRWHAPVHGIEAV